MYTRDEILKIHKMGQKYGGSFIVALTDALLKADETNQIKLVSQFKEDFDRYLNIL